MLRAYGVYAAACLYAVLCLAIVLVIILTPLTPLYPPPPPRISRAYAHILAFFSTDVKRRQSLYDEDSLDGDHPSENEGITFSRAVAFETLILPSFTILSYE